MYGTNKIGPKTEPCGTPLCIGTRKAVDLVWNPSVCHIFYLFRCVLSSVVPLRSVGMSNFDRGLHILTTTLIQDDLQL